MCSMRTVYQNSPLHFFLLSGRYPVLVDWVPSSLLVLPSFSYSLPVPLDSGKERRTMHKEPTFAFRVVNEPKNTRTGKKKVSGGNERKRGTLSRGE